MNAAKNIISKFDGQSSLAKRIGTSQGTVFHWAKTGNIPIKWHRKIIQEGEKDGIVISEIDFISSVSDEVLSESTVPISTHFGELIVGDVNLPCYVLNNGERVLSSRGIVSSLMGSSGGNLAEYLKVKNIRSFLPDNLIPLEDNSIELSVVFDTGLDGDAKYALGITAEGFMSICIAYSSALDSGYNITTKQRDIAIRANIFLRACAKVGLIALIDEVTGYQYDRAHDVLSLKLKLYLEEEMRQWEKTFPDELWMEFGRLTKWEGSSYSRPKYWGKLVMELVYNYLDKDVSEWLKNNAPKPSAGCNYHQWLNSQYGLKKLVEHIWMVIGMARACHSMSELRERLAQQFGRQKVQLNMFLPMPCKPRAK